MRILAVIYKFSRVIPASSLLDHDHGAKGRGRVCQLPRLCSTTIKFPFRSCYTCLNMATIVDGLRESAKSILKPWQFEGFGVLEGKDVFAILPIGGFANSMCFQCLP